ncbi:sigma-54-dependent Fis family transcriptional regulator [Neomegalonema sp.]|uniref:sigma-54-dependent Fis family transcriptional regulator n=1 Tax=Neomegalonema sp. TaxID=2039713 RepID=UPI00263591F3|nr:sigma-54-dependent Fis family transcriptional regulator [Neomegalonema sp.]MDD2870016.1 sigma-54-dependent Fis family transcriptional regulator [Neomegalonema sp.]
MSAAAPLSFADPAFEPDIRKDWTDFMSGARGRGGEAVRSVIAESWLRCQNSSVDHRRGQGPAPMNEGRFRGLLDKRERLLAASAPAMALAREYLFETGTVMVLTDADGVVLRLEGDRTIALRDAVEKIHLLPGARWSEDAIGTNAIGTALELGMPIQVHAAEHFCEGIQRWSCSASAIRDPADGAILGAIDISGLSASYGRASLALAVSAAGQIEEHLKRCELERRHRLLDRCLDALPHADSHHVALFDGAGRLFRSNGETARILRDLGAPEDRAAFPLLDYEAEDLRSRAASWIRPEWLRLIVSEGERLGAVMIAPKSGASRSAPRAPCGFQAIIRGDARTERTVEASRRAAACSAPVLLQGETGVGKEVFARAIHAGSRFRGAPCVVVDCGALNRELLASALFGYAEGAFTGARRGGAPGKIEAARGGTLFLDEIGELPLDMQPMLLRAVETGEICRLGETTPRKVDFRLIAATNRNLLEEARAGRFRRDLYYRLAVLPIEIPPLRERLGDVAPLVERFCRQAEERYGLPRRDFGPDALKSLQAQAWPGNVRELRNRVEQILVNAEGATGGLIGLSALPPDLVQAAPCAGPGDEGLSLTEANERALILRALEDCGGNVTAAARALGRAKSTLYAKMRRYGLEERRASPRL